MLKVCRTPGQVEGVCSLAAASVKSLEIKTYMIRQPKRHDFSCNLHSDLISCIPAGSTIAE